MSPRIAKVLATVTLGYTLALLPALCAADTPTGTSPATKPIDWSQYTSVATVVGEIVKADKDKLTLRITWFEPQKQNTNNKNKNNNNNKNKNNGRPNLNGNKGNFRNPYAKNNNRPDQVKITWKEEHHDYVLEYVPESLVRVKALPPKFDENGKRVNHTNPELAELRAPDGAPWYVASPDDLKPGTIVEVSLIRDRKLAPAAVKEGDLRVKFAVILGQDPNPPKDLAKAKADPKKAKN